MGKKTRSKAKKKMIQQRREAGIEDPNKHWCLFCKCFIPNSEVSLNEHYVGRMHCRLEKLHSYILFFEEHGIFLTTGEKTYECRICSTTGIPADAKKLKAHLLDVHLVGPKKKHPFGLSQSQIWSSDEKPDVIERVQKNRPKVYWVHEYKLEEECTSFEKVSSPTLCVDSSGCGFHFLLVNGRFHSNALTMMTELATFLEAEGNPTRHGEMKRGDHDSKIVTFGFRYAYGRLGRLVF